MDDEPNLTVKVWTEKYNLWIWFTLSIIKITTTWTLLTKSPIKVFNHLSNFKRTSSGNNNFILHIFAKESVINHSYVLMKDKADHAQDMGISLTSKCWCFLKPKMEDVQHVFLTSPTTLKIWRHFSSCAGNKH